MVRPAIPELFVSGPFAGEEVETNHSPAPLGGGRAKPAGS